MLIIKNCLLIQSLILILNLLHLLREQVCVYMGRWGKLGFGLKLAGTFDLRRERVSIISWMAEAWKLGRGIQTLLSSEIIVTHADHNHCLSEARNSQWGDQGVPEDSQASIRNYLVLEFPPCWSLPNMTAHTLWTRLLFSICWNFVEAMLLVEFQQAL